MGEAMMFRYPSEGGSSGNTLITQIFKENSNFTVPKGVKQVDVRIFGGGGGGISKRTISGAGGGGGWMNNAIINVTPGEVIPITIGAGGLGKFNTASSIANAGSGGTTSFGTYLSAAGGKGGSIYYGTSNVTISNINMGFFSNISIGGDGGSGGGAVAAVKIEFSNSGNMGYIYTGLYTSGVAFGGHGHQFGGGGACAYSTWYTMAGNGGIWGGGGGGTSIDLNRTGNVKGGIGGTYGGNGGCNSSGSYSSPENGTNTMSYTNISNDVKGNGLYGFYQNSSFNINNLVTTHNFGGGGYGGNGGKAFSNTYAFSTGGGGYGAHGGNIVICGVGGGGGYGKNGYGGTGTAYTIGGGGAYGPGGSEHSKPMDGGGGAGITVKSDNRGIYNSLKDRENGASGICIIQYYL